MTSSFQAGAPPWIVKDPAATLDYTIDWSDWLGADTISAATWAAETGVDIEDDSNTTTAATVWLSGGTAAADYLVTCQVTTAGGRIDERSFKVACRNR